jgi:hypothetical protein
LKKAIEIMTSEIIDFEEDEEVIPTRPRTMKRQPTVDVEEEEEAVAPTAPSSQQSDDEDDSESAGLEVPIHSGWTAGQKVMDSSSDYAQILKLDTNIQLIKFLDDQPYANYRRHWVDRMGPKGPTKRAYTCLETVGKTCPLCAIADRPQAVSAFNVALIGDDGQVLLKTWDVGAKLFNVIRAYSTDPKIGPLSKNYFAVNRTGKAQTTQYNVIPVRESALSEDYGINPPTEADYRTIGKYDASIIQIPKKTDLEEVAQEISDFD